jgi:hypothetical protein
MSDLCEFTKMQASEAHQGEQTIINGIEAMGNNIAKVMNTEIHVRLRGRAEPSIARRYNE